MSTVQQNRIIDILRGHEDEILREWARHLTSALGSKGRVTGEKIQDDCKTFVSLLTRAMESGEIDGLQGQAWTPVKDWLGEFSRERAAQGFSPSETATFVFSLKEPLFDQLGRILGNDAKGLATEVWRATQLLDKLGLYTTEVFQKNREDIIRRHQSDMLELSTPVIQLWDGILALPLIGTLDSRRSQIVMETLLQRVVETGAPIAIIDITGVPTVDTLVAQHLLKTVAAARLMGADCIISGIRPQIAQTMVTLGVELSDVITKATLADAFAVALSRSHLEVCERGARANGSKT